MAKRNPTLLKPVGDEGADDTSPSTESEAEPPAAASQLASNTNPKPRPKPRPLKQKLVTNEGVALESTPDVAGEGPHQNGTSKRSSATHHAESQSAAKKQKIGGTTSPGKAMTARSRSKVIPPRSPLPNRSTRVINPGAPDKKRTKRSQEEVAAATKQRDELRSRLEEIEKQKIEMLAQMEAAEEEDDLEEERRVINHTTDLMDVDEDQMDPNDKEEAEPEGDEVAMVIDEANTQPTGLGEAGATSNDDSDSWAREPEPPVKMQRKKKATKGATRAAVDKMKAEITKRPIHKRTTQLTGKTTQTASNKAPLPSGLVPDWKKRVSAPRNTPKIKGTQPGAPSNPIGGLTDEDAHGERPKSATSPSQSVTSEVDVYEWIESYDDWDEDFTEFKPGGREKYEAWKANKKILVDDPDPEFVIYERKPDLSTLVARQSQDVRGLPEFARADWTSRFLPTLYHRFRSSDQPWKAFTKGNEMVAIIQEVVNEVYPRHKYKYRARWGDRLCAMASDRLCDKRCYFGRQALLVVEEFFQGEKFANNPTRIAKYAAWATRDDGPGIWRVPAPIGCKNGPDSKDYSAPVDIFQSEFIIKTFTPFVKWCKGSCADYGYLIGALALSAAGIERAFKMFLSGKRQDIGQFSCENVEPLVIDYLVNTAKLSNRRWKIIMEQCGVEAEVPAARTNVPSMDERRRALYIPSSPRDGLDED